MDQINDIATQEHSLRFVGEWSKLCDALVKAQASFPRLKRSSTGRVSASATFKFADQDEQIEATRAHLAKHGIGVLQPPHGKDADYITTVIFGHGGRIEITWGFERAKDIKQLGAQLTYLTRYIYKNTLVLGGGEDADESPDAIETAPRQRPAARRQGPAMMTKDQGREVQRLLKALDTPKAEIDAVLESIIDTSDRSSITENMAVVLIAQLTKTLADFEEASDVPE